MIVGQDTLKTRNTLKVNGKDYAYYSLAAAAKAGIGNIDRLPYAMKVLLENLLRFEDGRSVSVDDIKALGNWTETQKSDREIAYRPGRVLLQDFTGVPAIVDLAAMRQAMGELGGDPKRINPLSPVDLVIDHSVMVDQFGSSGAFQSNVTREYERNQERYSFLRWGASAFDNLRVVPPGTGICHQVNLEYLAQTVWTRPDASGCEVAYPDTLVGTDSHTTMVNGLAVLGWGVGGIEAEACMLGQPTSMLIPEVVGFKLTGSLQEGRTATDLVLTITQMLRQKGVVGKFVEFYGDGLGKLSLADRATIANMAPEYGATCGFFPIDAETCRYLHFTGRDADRVALVEAYARAQGMWREQGSPDPIFTDTLGLDMNQVEPTLAGPKRPQDKVLLSHMKTAFLEEYEKIPTSKASKSQENGVSVAGTDYKLKNGAIVIAAITSCTNTSNPSVLVAAGLVARKAHALGLQVKPWVKTSLAPGSQVVTDYLIAAGLQKDLDALGFNLVGYGCTTCIGNSGPLLEAIEQAISENNLMVGSVLSGNRNFEGRVHPLTQVNYLASPPLVVGYALAGMLDIDLTKEALGVSNDGKPVYLKDIWPSNQEIADTITQALSPEMYRTRYACVFDGDANWRKIATSPAEIYDWSDASTYVKYPPFFSEMKVQPEPIADIIAAQPLAILADSITTDHISPAGSIKADSPAGSYLMERQIKHSEFNSYGSRRGNHEIMMRGTFANIRIRNEMVAGVEGGVTKHHPSGDLMPIHDAAMRYQAEKVPLIVIAGKEYGTGSSRDWAAKGTRLLGVRVVLAESFERIHRANLVGMGVLPLQFVTGQNRKNLHIKGTEKFSITGLMEQIEPRSMCAVTIIRADGHCEQIDTLCRIDTLDELDYFRHGGILQYVMRDLMKAA